MSNLPDLLTTGLSSSRAFVRGLALCLLHFGAHFLGLLHGPLALGTPWTRAVYSDCVTLVHTAQIPAGTVVACSTGFHQTGSTVVTRIIWLWLAFITMYSTLRCVQLCKCFVLLGRLCSPASNSAVSLFVKRESFMPSDVSLSSNNMTSSPRPQPEFVLVIHASQY